MTTPWARRLALSAHSARRLALSAGLFAAVWIIPAAAKPRAAPTSAPVLVRVLLETEKGEIELEIDSTHAPITAKNFLRYVDGAYYDGGRFHRTVRADNQPNDSVKIAVIQAGISSSAIGDGFPAIPLERTTTTGLHHIDGAISMARAQVLNSARSDFFICVGAQPALDSGGKRAVDRQGFAVFGRVVRGMDVVRAINASNATAQTLTPPIGIRKARRIK